MQRKHMPSMGARYWTALTIVSVFGANLGDYSSHDLHLGHALGLIPMAALLGAVFLLERRDRSWNEIYYWLAIIIVRAAATNLGDLAASDFKLGRLWSSGVLIALLAGVLYFTRRALPVPAGEPKGQDELPPTNAIYWTAMLIAGTIGTVLGDYASFGLGLGTRNASLILGAFLLVVFLIGSRGLFALVAYYWFTIVTVRTAGTAMGDYLAGKAVGIGLASSTLCTGVIFAATLWLWKDQASRRLKSVHQAPDKAPETVKERS